MNDAGELELAPNRLVVRGTIFIVAAICLAIIIAVNAYLTNQFRGDMLREMLWMRGIHLQLSEQMDAVATRCGPSAR